MTVGGGEIQKEVVMVIVIVRICVPALTVLVFIMGYIYLTFLPFPQDTLGVASHHR